MDPTPRLPDGAASARGSDLAIGPTGADHEAARRLCGRSLMVARGAWLGVVALTLGLAIPGFVIAFDRPELLQQPELLGLADRLGLPKPGPDGRWAPRADGRRLCHRHLPVLA